jgi:glycosyltransferase 2 family protein
MRKRRVWRWLMAAFAVAVAALAIFLVQRQLRRYSLDDILRSVEDVPAARLAACACFVALSYAALTLFDTLGVRYAGKDIPYRRIAVASFCSLSIGHNLGFAALSTGALRMRFYTRMGLRVGDVARVILFCATTVALGLFSLAALVLLAAVPPQEAGLSLGTARLLGGVCLALVLAYLALAFVARAPLRLGGWVVPLPSPGLALAQVAVGFANFAFVAAALWQAIAAATGAGYFDVVVAYVMGQAAGLVSHVPGGLGVLEAVVLLVLPNAGAIGGLVLFRVLYFLVPLVLGVLALAAIELRVVRSRRRGGSPTGGGGSFAGGTGIGFGGSSIGGGARGSGGGGAGGVTGG